jgi:UDP-2,3-diacylglucosamine pyrophosphatase LpxH
MIIAVSDVHLGCKNSNKDDFLRFLNKCDEGGIDHLVLLGDIFDFWVRNNAKLIIEHEDILGKLANLNVKNLHYIVGNHDYFLLRLKRRHTEYYPFSISRALRLTDNGINFYFIHGYELEVISSYEPLTIEGYENFCERMCFSEDFIGSYVSNFWNRLENLKGSWWKIRTIEGPPLDRGNINKVKELALSKSKFVLLGMKYDEKLVYGHTHVPFISEDRSVANTGSWIDEGPKNPMLNTYLKIENGEIELKVFNEKDFP